jgi:hypothetical protein
MDDCLSCHEHQADWDAGRCSPCHADLTRFPLEPIAKFSHRGDFLAEHGEQARAGSATCASCHDQTFCAACHGADRPLSLAEIFPEDVERRFIHRGDIRGRHPAEARADNASCMSCHGTSFCSSCHATNELVPSPTSRDPHPPGWSFPGSGEFHGEAARRNITTCAACHDQGAASVCVDCHRVGGIGGNPHPDSWLDRHDADEIAGNGMCLACH